MAEMRVHVMWCCTECGHMNPVIQDERAVYGNAIPVTCQKCGWKAYVEMHAGGGGHYGHERDN